MSRAEAVNVRETFERLLWTASVHQWARQTMDLLDVLINCTAAADIAYLRDAVQTVFADGDRKKEEYIVGLILSAKLGDDRQRTIDHAIRHLFQKLQHRDFHFICEYLFEEVLPLPENLIYDITARIIFDIRDRFDQIAQDFKHVPKKNAEPAILYLAFELCRADLNLQNRDLLYLILSRIQVPMPARLVSIANENLDRIRTSLQNKGIKDLEAITFSEYEDETPARPDEVSVPKVDLPKSQREDYYTVRRTLESPDYQRSDRETGEGQGPFADAARLSNREAAARDQGQDTDSGTGADRPPIPAAPRSGKTDLPSAPGETRRGNGSPGDNLARTPARGPGKESKKEREEPERSGLNFSRPAPAVDQGPRKDVTTRNEKSDSELPSAKSGSPERPETPPSADRPRRQRREAETTDAEGMGLDLGTIDDILREGVRGGKASGQSEESSDKGSAPQPAKPATERAGRSVDPEPATGTGPTQAEPEAQGAVVKPEIQKKAQNRKVRSRVRIAGGLAAVVLIVLIAIIATGRRDSPETGGGKPAVLSAPAVKGTKGTDSPVTASPTAPATQPAAQSPISAFDTSVNPADSSLDIRESAGVTTWTVGSGQSFWTVFSSQSGGANPNGSESWSSFIARIRGLNPGLAKVELIYPGQSYRIR